MINDGLGGRILALLPLAKKYYQDAIYSELKAYLSLLTLMALHLLLCVGLS